MNKNIDLELSVFYYGILGWIIGDIKEKYKVENPIFMIEGTIVDDPYVIQNWANFQIGNQLWIKYKHIKDDIFELKTYFPQPPDKTCKKLINDVFDDVNKDYKNVYYKIQGILYNEKQARKEMIYYLRKGYENIYYDKPTLDNKVRYVCKLDFCPESEEYWSLDKGYLILEEK